MENMTEELKESYDVMIVGSGPAGGASAKALSDAGLKTVIIEKCSLPRDIRMGSALDIGHPEYVSVQSQGLTPSHKDQNLRRNQ